MKFKGELNIDMILKEGKSHNQVDIEPRCG